MSTIPEKIYIIILSIVVCLLLKLEVNAQADNSNSLLTGKIDTRIKIDLVIGKADSLFALGLNDEALDFYDLVVLSSDLIKYKEGVVRAKIAIAEILFLRNDGVEANQILDSILKGLKKEDGSVNRWKTYIFNLKATETAFKGWFDESIEYYEHALKTSNVYPHERISSLHIYRNMAQVYLELKMYDKLFTYLARVEELLEKNYDPEIRTLVELIKIQVYENRKDSLEVAKSLSTALHLADSIDDQKTMFILHEKMGTDALKKNNVPDAKKNLKLMQVLKQIPPLIKSREYRLAANIYKLEKNYSRALVAYYQMLELSKKTKSIKWESIASEGLSEVYALKGNYKAAYENEIRVRILKDSLNTQDQKRNIANIEQKYQAAEKDKEIAEKELLITTQKNGLRTRNIILIASVLVISLLFILFLISRRNHKRKQHLQEEQMRLYEREKELDEMRALMSGEEQERNRIARDIHDGLMIQFSTVKMNLSSILSKQDNVKPYLLQLDKAIASLRSTAHNLMPDVLLEGGLAEAIYYFCENIKQHVAFEVTFNMLDDVPRFDEKFELAVYRIVQELIQNIVKHAQANEAYIQIGYREGMLNITIEDDGIGLEQSAPDAQKGLGLMSIKNRMQALQGTVEISSEVNSGTSIVLEFSVEALSIENNKK